MIYTENEWSNLKRIVVGTATNAHWPVDCPIFRQQEQKTRWKESPVPKGLVDTKIVNETNQDLEKFCNALTRLNVKVERPKDLIFEEFDGMYNYCPRDRVLIVGDKVIDAPMLYPTRQKELEALCDFFDTEIISCTDNDAIFDAANVCRLGDDLLYLVSESGNLKGAEWLQKTLGKQYKVHVLDNAYAGVHIDSTISPIRDGLVVLNADRINTLNCPQVFRNWDKIYIGSENISAQGFFQYPYASKYIALNFLTVNPYTVICDPNQTYLRNKLDEYNIDTLGVELRHSRTLGGGHHCVTLDLERS